MNILILTGEVEKIEREGKEILKLIEKQKDQKSQINNKIKIFLHLNRIEQAIKLIDDLNISNISSVYLRSEIHFQACLFVKSVEDVDLLMQKDNSKLVTWKTHSSVSYTK